MTNSIETEVALLKAAELRNIEAHDKLAVALGSLDTKVDAIAVSLARYNGMIGWIVLIGTSMVAAVKLTYMYTKA